MQFVGLDQIVDHIVKKLGNLDQVYLTGDLAEGRNSPFVDLVLVGEIDKSYLYQLIELYHLDVILIILILLKNIT
jgi:hypothetical protein